MSYQRTVQIFFKRNMLDRYIDRPNSTFKGGKYSVIDQLCFSQFLSHYYLVAKPQDDANDSQPQVLLDDLVEVNNVSTFPKNIPLMSSKEKLKCRKVKAVLRYHVPNPHKYAERYAHHLLFMFYLFRKEADLMSAETGMYMDRLNEPSVITTINANKQIFEPYGDLVDCALRNLRNDLQNNTDSFAQQENDEVQHI